MEDLTVKQIIELLKNKLESENLKTISKLQNKLEQEKGYKYKIKLENRYKKRIEDLKKSRDYFMLRLDEELRKQGNLNANKN